MIRWCWPSDGQRTEGFNLNMAVPASNLRKIFPRNRFVVLAQDLPGDNRHHSASFLAQVRSTAVLRFKAIAILNNRDRLPIF
jgi:hypothetical protein